MFYHNYYYTISQGILILIWKLSSPLVTGIFIAVNVLDTVTNFGQVNACTCTYIHIHVAKVYLC